MTKTEEAKRTCITREFVDRWLEKNRPHLATHEVGKKKGIYEISKGPAASFENRGGTWRQVFESIDKN